MTTKTLTILTVCALILPAAGACAEEAPSPAEQVAAMKQMCLDNAAARAERHAANALYNRLGGYDKIHAFTTEVVRLHKKNDDIKHLFTRVDSEALAKHVADFVALGTGGQATYAGRDLPSSHSHLHLTDADFLSAGGDIVTAMQTMGYGQNEIDEMVCILVSLKDQVVRE